MSIIKQESKLKLQKLQCHSADTVWECFDDGVRVYRVTLACIHQIKAIHSPVTARGNGVIFSGSAQIRNLACAVKWSHDRPNQHTCRYLCLLDFSLFYFFQIRYVTRSVMLCWTLTWGKTLMLRWLVVSLSFCPLEGSNTQGRGTFKMDANGNSVHDIG